MDFLNKVLNLLIVLAVVTLAGSFFYFNDLKQKSAAQRALRDSKATPPADVQAMVNTHLQEIEKARQIEKLRMEAALSDARKQVKAEFEATVKKENQQNMNISKDKQIWKEEEVKQEAKIEVRPKAKPQPQYKFTEPDDTRGQEIDISKLSPEEKREYKRQYIENARKGGYQIELSDDLQVIKATPIRKPSQQNDTINTPQTD